jgi:hypothetical protein
MMPLIKTQKKPAHLLSRGSSAQIPGHGSRLCLLLVLGQARGRVHGRTMHTHSAMAKTVVRLRDRGKWWWVRLHCSYTSEHFSELD